MNTRSHICQASQVQSMYSAVDNFDDQESESETEDIIEEQHHEFDEEESDVDGEAAESESFDNEDKEVPSTNKGKRSRPSYLRGKNSFK
ncbi:hypothetical protein ABEB36_014674 [Hypothenemus hampei]|uniref:Uncharacterized protein n=1 Tax=Hypothenemus hampei TaxID=57062 RepID=A0ABD1E3D0_HYPHA